MFLFLPVNSKHISRYTGEYNPLCYSVESLGLLSKRNHAKEVAYTESITLHILHTHVYPPSSNKVQESMLRKVKVSRCFCMHYSDYLPY